MNIILNNIGLVETWKQTLLNGFLQIWNITIAISASLLTERFGRRTLWLVSTAGMALTYTFITVTAAVYRNTATWGEDPDKPDAPGSKSAGNAFIFFVRRPFVHISLARN